MTEDGRVRHSEAGEAPLARTPEEIAKQEAANSIRQANRVREYILQSLEGRPFRLRPSMVLDLNRCAIDGLSAYAGVYRPAGIEIGKSKHRPPGGHLVPELVEDMCDYVNDSWQDRSAVHLAAFIMWRLNWIHPFTDGNGRTSRATSYLVMCIRSGILFPGKKSIPEQIVENRGPYYDALEAADQRYVVGERYSEDIVETMESLIGGMLASQLTGVLEEATR